MRQTSLVLLAAAVAVACTRTNMAVMDPSLKLARTCPEAVLLFTTSERVPSEYKEVALLNSTGSTGFTSEQGMMLSMRKKAAEAGANGIVLQGINEPNAATKVIGAFLGTGSERKGKALAIWIPADSAKSAAACREAAAKTQSP